MSLSIKDRLTEIQEFLNSKKEEMAKAFNGNISAEKAIRSVLNEVAKSIGTDNDLSFKTSQSIYRAMQDAASFGIPIDGTGMAYLVPYKNEVKFQPSYRAYMAKLNASVKGFVCHSGIVREGDGFYYEANGLETTYLHKPNPFSGGDVKGYYVYISFVSEGSRVSRIMVKSKEEIDKHKNVSKTKFAWNSWYDEMAIKTCIRAACKYDFAMHVADLDRADNEHFEIQVQAERKTNIIQEALEYGDSHEHTNN
jgi:recombination protein RecT